MAPTPKLDLATIKYLVKHIDASPAVTWTGKGGVKERIEEIMSNLTGEHNES